jgi:hypothetical protein
MKERSNIRIKTVRLNRAGSEIVLRYEKASGIIREPLRKV